MKKNVRAYAIGIFVVGCGSQAGGGFGASGDPSAHGNAGDVVDDGVSGRGSTNGGTEPKRPVDLPRSMLARGLSVSAVELFQGVGVRLASAGKRVKSKVPIVAKRPGMIRAFVQPDATWIGHEVTGELHLTNNGEPVATLQDKKTIIAMSTEEDLKSTFDFKITADLMMPGVGYSVSILDTVGDDPSSATSAAKYPSSSASDPLVTSTVENILRIRVVPIIYDGHTPDVSAANIERYRKLMFAMYPTSAVQIEVRDPWAFQGDLGAQGMGFGDLVQSLIDLRSSEVESQNIYYYGVINPAASIVKYCSQGCVAGLTISSTENADDPAMRVSAGLGFPGQETTMAHEIGHAHGRLHAPCTQVGQMASIDTSYPRTKAYENGNDRTELGGGTGVWGYSIVSKSMFDPVRSKDIMGYCQQNWSIWISDYTYSALFDRIAEVSGSPIAANGTSTPPPAPSAPIATAPQAAKYRFVGVDAAGKLSWGRTVSLGTRPSSAGHRVTFRTAEGATDSEVRGHYYAYSDMPGGVMVIPEPAAHIRSIRIHDLMPDIGIRDLARLSE